MPATKKKPQSAAAAVSALEADTLRQWRTWAADLAAGRTGPDPAAVLEAGRTLGLADPGVTLDADVAAIHELAAAEARLERDRAALKESVAPYGGDSGLAAEIERRRTELRQLEALASPWRYLSIGHAQGRVGRLKAANARLFGPG